MSPSELTAVLVGLAVLIPVVGFLLTQVRTPK